MALQARRRDQGCTHSLAKRRANRHRVTFRAPLSALASLALCSLSSSAVATQEPPPNAPPLTFAAAFEALGEPSPITSPEPGAVDLTSFETPLEIDRVIRSLGTKVASYYGKRFHGRLTANGERFDMNAMTAAHKTLPFGTRVRVTNPRNGHTVTVRINDRGPYIRGREIDLSRAAAAKIGIIQRGHARVQLEIVEG
ncbi:MAG: septal ring lytic transglycosylase RlpA family protein [Pseudomonadota bacterium]